MHFFSIRLSAMRQITSKIILALVVLASAVMHIAPADAALAAAASCGTYIVKAGDTISSLSLRLDLSHTGLVSANDLSDTRGVQPGQKLLLPCETPSPGRAPQPHHLKVANAPGNPLPQSVTNGGKVVYVSIAKQRGLRLSG